MHALAEGKSSFFENYHRWFFSGLPPLNVIVPPSLPTSGQPLMIWPNLYPTLIRVHAMHALHAHCQGKNLMMKNFQ